MIISQRRGKGGRGIVPSEMFPFLSVLGRKLGRIKRIQREDNRQERWPNSGQQHWASNGTVCGREKKNGATACNAPLSVTPGRPLSSFPCLSVPAPFPSASPCLVSTDRSAPVTLSLRALFLSPVSPQASDCQLLEDRSPVVLIFA